MGETVISKEARNRIEYYGSMVDHFAIGREFGKLKLLLDEMDRFKNSNVEITNDAAFNYYYGTGLGTYSDYLVRTGKSHADSEVIGLRRMSMFYLRKGISLYNPTVHTDPRAQLRILTNYANGLDTVGRVLEALRIYRIVIERNNHFAIALGNYGRALQFLANMVNDGGHYKELHCYAYQSIKKALGIDDPDLHEQAVSSFQSVISNYESMPIQSILAEPIVYKEYELGETEEEIQYRKWCLKHHIFLNPLNEVLELESAFAHDPLTITSFTEDIHCNDSVAGNEVEPPRWFAMLNQLKEEYVYARYLCFAGSEEYGDVHFADKNVTLSLASFDYANYSIRIEQLKSSYRILYSMLDQICFFVNDFWKMGLDERKADARNICKAVNYPKSNIALMSLYWVLCEFFEKYGDADRPFEKDLALLRNAMEHKFVKVHENNWDRKLQIEIDSFYHISEEELKKDTMRLLELSREALIYLVYATGIEERKKGKLEKSVSMQIVDFPDEWKR